MTRKSLSIIGRIIGLLLVVAIAFFASWCIANPAKAEAEWNKIFNKTPQQEQPNEPDQPTPDKPSEEQINLDGLYYLDVDGDTYFVQIKDSKYGTINGYVKDSKIYLASDWETDVELEPYHTTEDDKYLHVFVTDQANGQEYKIAIYDKATKKLYYDFSNGDQFPGETYEDQLLFEMVKFDEYEISDPSSEVCEHDWVEDLSYVPTAPSCGEYWNTQYKCSKCNETKLETNGPLPHDYVNGVCSRCGESETTITTPEITINDNALIICNFDGNGTVNLYYRELGTDAWSSYVAGPVDEFDLTILLSRDWQPMERGKTYEIYVVFSNGNQQSSDSNIVEYAPECEHNFEKVTCSTTCVSDGTEVEECSICGLKRYNSIPAYGHNYVNGVCSRCGESDPNSVSEITLSINSSTSEDFWLLFDVSSIKDYLLSEDPNNTDGFVFEVFLENSTTHETNKIMTRPLSQADFNVRFGVDKMFASDFSQGNYNLSIIISSSTNFKIDNISPVSFNHDGSHYLLTLSA